MTPAEVEAVLELWREVEGTRPGGFFVARSGTVPAILSPSGLRADQAYDALCGHLRRWLEARCCDYRIRFRREKGYFVAWSARPGDLVHSRIGETLLLTLIAAVRAVAGTTGQPQEIKP